MDNLPTHKSTKTIKEMNELGFRHIFNLAYSPELNPIELVFAKISAAFKALRAQKLAGQIQDDHNALIHKAVKAVRK